MGGAKTQIDISGQLGFLDSDQFKLISCNSFQLQFVSIPCQDKLFGLEIKPEMFPLLNRNIPHVEEKILSFLDTKSLAASMLVCKEWCRKASPFLYECYATIQRKEGTVPLQMAVANGHNHLVAFFLRDKQVNVNEMAKTYGCTALMDAAILGEERVTRMLLEREDIDINMKSRYWGMAALSLAGGIRHAGVVKILLERQDILVNACNNDGYTVLMEAAIRRDMDMVEELLKHPDIDVNIHDQKGHTALSFAKMQNLHFDLTKHKEKMKIIQMLEEKMQCEPMPVGKL